MNGIQYIEIPRTEILRYLGYGRHEADEQVHSLVEQCVQELKRTAQPRHIVREFPLQLKEDYEIDCTCLVTHSKNLWKNLADCDRILLFAATLGTEVDHLIERYNKIQMSKAVILQAASAAMLEEYCDQVNENIKREYLEKKLYLRPRFSPGYGDLPLECQVPFSQAMELNKRVGITLTDSLLMSPSKSVTAFIGVSSIQRECTTKGCEVCRKTNCAYRRG